MDIYSDQDRDIRRTALLKHFEFKCTCPVCVDVDFIRCFHPDFPVLNRRVILNQDPKTTIEEVLKEFKEHCEYFKNNFEQCSTNELAGKSIVIVLDIISAMSFWPFEQLIKYKI